MNKQIYVNLPVSDLEKSTEFYAKLGFVKNDVFSDENASGMVWSDNIIVMLLARDFYKTFIGGKEIADTAASNSVLLAVNLETKEDVDSFARTAEENGGSSFKVETGIPEDQMYGLEVLDPDGHQWEAMWMAEN